MTMWRGLFLFTIHTALLVTNVWSAQNREAKPSVVVKEIHFAGDLGLPLDELQQYTQHLNGHRGERARILQEAQSSVSGGLRHRGYWKAQVTPEIRPEMNSKLGEIALELVLKAGKQYRIKEITFAGLSTELPQVELRQAFDLQQGDIADGTKISVGIGSIQSLFHRHGKDVYVVPMLTFDEVASTVSFRFVIGK